MADESFKAKLEKIIVELQKELREKNHSRQELLIIQKRILNSLMEEEKKEKQKILEIGKIETTGNSDIVELGKKWSRLAAVDDFVLNHKNNLTPELALDEKEETDELLLTPDPQLALKKKESEKIIQEIAPQIEVPNPTIQMMEAIKTTEGISSTDADNIVKFLTTDFIDDRPTSANAFLMWLEKDKQAVAAEEKRVEIQESKKQLLKRRNTYLKRDDSESSLLNSSISLDRIIEPKKELSGNLRPLIVKRSGDDGEGKLTYVKPDDPRVKNKPTESVPEYIENSGPELSEEQIAAKLAESEELMKQNIPIERQRGGKKRKITKKKKKSKKRKTKRRYKTGKRN